uniref:MFS transporter n=1 Tax=Eubacterium cellulosolvens TaxID=29322 RepID=UPI000480E44A|nr:MFS transporter [[Eubacterium] cellulosolvens]
MRELKRLNPYMRLVFLFSFFALSIGDAFNVLYIRDMAESFAPKDRIALYTGIPVTAMTAMMIAGVGASNYIARKKGDFSSFLQYVLACTLAGMVIRGLAFHYLLMLAGFMAVGFGYGCFYIGIRYYAYLFEQEKVRMETMAFISGGAFAGQCMGTVLGGIMAGQLPYRTVYLFAVVLMIPPVWLCRKYRVNERIGAGRIRESIRILKKPNIVLYLLLLVIPLFACTVFTSYLVPLEVDGYGYSATVISALLLGANMIAAYAGPYVTVFITSVMRPLVGTIVYCLGVALFIAVYVYGKSFPVLVLVVLLLGFLDSFGPSVMTGAYTGLLKGDRPDVSGPLLIYILVTRFGMTIAPTLLLLFGTPLALSGMVFAGIILFLAVQVLAQKKR